MRRRLTSELQLAFPFAERSGITVGQVFGRLIVVRRATPPCRHARWHVRCVCGAERVVLQQNLRNGKTRSCGCLVRERLRKIAVRHGFSGTKEYANWKGMIARCNDTQNSSYGGRGIKVCDRWRTYEHFLADMGHRPPGMTLDRIDVNGNYEPGNCRWATRAEQNRNKTNTRILEFKGERLSVTSWSERLGISPQLLWWRLSRWGVERTLTTRVRRSADLS